MSANVVRLGVNIDHVATVRQARGGVEPDPVLAAAIAEHAGANGITIHLREDRRHIQERDLRALRETVKTHLNLEMGCADEIIAIALDVKPDQVTLVPEKRQELTTEGGLDVVRNLKNIQLACEKFRKAGVLVSLFIAPDDKQIKASVESGAECVELHTGEYCNSKTEEEVLRNLSDLIKGATLAAELGLRVYAGHGLNYVNVRQVVAIPQVEELNIGHSIIARAVFVGLDRAVREMKELLIRK